MVNVLSELLQTYFYILDFFIAGIILGLVTILYLAGRISRFYWILFWVGCALGLTWELGCNINMLVSENYPVARFITPPPFHFIFAVISHSIWDGGLFLIGAILVHKICTPPWFETFKMSELLVLLIWGQVQALAVEILSVFSSAWEWIVYWWNPSLFIFHGHAVTLLPQLIWLLAMLIFYPVAIAVARECNK